MVDDEDFKWLNESKWYFNNTGYAVRGNPIKLLMHRVIINAPKGIEVDYINLNRLDNRKVNLRLCTRADNCHNREKYKCNTSGYKGVYWDNKAKKWSAKIRNNNKLINIGFFNDKLEAARAYDFEAIKLFKNFSKLNLSI